jgi:hypothetical protein
MIWIRNRIEVKGRIRNRLRIKETSRIRIRIKMTSRIWIRIKMTSRSRIRIQICINMMRIRDTARESYVSGSRITADPGTSFLKAVPEKTWTLNRILNVVPDSMSTSNTLA